MVISCVCQILINSEKWNIVRQREPPQKFLLNGSTIYVLLKQLFHEVMQLSSAGVWKDTPWANLGWRVFTGAAT